MCTGSDMSGRTLLQTRKAATHALGEVRARGGVVLADNDNRSRRGQRVGRDRHEGDAAVHLREHPQQKRKAIAMVLEREPVGVLRLGLEVLRGVFQIEGALRHLGSCAGVRVLSALDLDGKTRRMDRERAGSAATSAAQGEEVLGVGHGGLQAGDRHRG
jgi:hypothetical protein